MTQDDPRLTAYALGELDDEERAEVEALIAEDDDALKAVQDTMMLAELLTEAMHEVPEKGAEAPRMLFTRRRVVTALSVFAAAAVVLLCLGFFFNQQINQQILDQPVPSQGVTPLPVPSVEPELTQGTESAPAPAPSPAAPSRAESAESNEAERIATTEATESDGGSEAEPIDCSRVINEMANLGQQGMSPTALEQLRQCREQEERHVRPRRPRRPSRARMRRPAAPRPRRPHLADPFESGEAHEMPAAY